MRTVNFKVFFEEQFLPSIGKDPLDFAVGTGDGNRMLGYVNDALADAFRNAFWSEHMVIEERTPGDDYEVDWTATGKTDIDAIEGFFATEQDARDIKGHLNFSEGPGGFRVFGAPSTVWARIRPYPPVFSRTQWLIGTAYILNNTAYTATLGKCWRCVKANTGNNPETDDGTNWEEVLFPEEFVPFVKAKASAPNYMFENQFEQSGRKESKAEEILFYLKKSKGR